MSDELPQAVGAPLERNIRPRRGDNVQTFKREGVTCWKCPNCDRVHALGPYVFAHWDDDLQHTCDCGHKHSILRGNVTYCWA